jgi:hypothetical protein
MQPGTANAQASPQASSAKLRRQRGAMAARLRQRATQASVLRWRGRTAAQHRCRAARAERGASHMRFGRIKSVTRGHTRKPPTRWVLSLALVCVVPACCTGWRAAEGGFGGTELAQKWGPPARRHLAAAQRGDAPLRGVAAVPARVGRAAARPSRASLQRRARCGGGGGGNGTRACCGRRGVRHRKATALRCTSRRHVPATAQRELGARRELARLVTWRRRSDTATGLDTHALPNALHR